jgi:hypothetical protein
MENSIDCEFRGIRLKTFKKLFTVQKEWLQKIFEREI